jgi:hypothetical protein
LERNQEIPDFITTKLMKLQMEKVGVKLNKLHIYEVAHGGNSMNPTVTRWNSPEILPNDSMHVWISVNSATCVYQGVRFLRIPPHDSMHVLAFCEFRPMCASRGWFSENFAT